MISIHHESLSDAAVQKVCEEATTPLSAGCLGCSRRCPGRSWVGELKKGDFEGFRVHKFKMVRQLTLMAYKLENDSLVLYQVGPHENFYRNLKKYLKEIGG